MLMLRSVLTWSPIVMLLLPSQCLLMCDRPLAPRRAFVMKAVADDAAPAAAAASAAPGTAVSYTHLTLPTILPV